MYYKFGSDMVGMFINTVPSAGTFAAELFLHEPDSVNDRFNYFDPAPAFELYTIEYSIPVDMLDVAYRQIMTLIKEYRQQKKTYVMRFWCRFQQASNQLNNLAYGRDSALVEVTIGKKQKHGATLAKQLSRILVDLGGKPHVGKAILEGSALKNYDFSYLQQAIKQYDPNGYFQNAFAAEFIARNG
jgi:hypothetical protein